MRGHKWKMLEAALEVSEITSREFAAATGLPAPQTSPYAHALVNDGYLKLLKEVPPERGGRPLKVYAWTGKQPPSRGGAYAEIASSVQRKADRVLINCFDRMVRCREDADARACAV
jgi:predicted ArsR family transcriptional regulator